MQVICDLAKLRKGTRADEVSSQSALLTVIALTSRAIERMVRSVGVVRVRTRRHGVRDEANEKSGACEHVYVSIYAKACVFG